MARTKITEDSATAFRNQRRFKRSNTVVRNEDSWNTAMYLFNNLIARYEPRKNHLWIDTCWRNTVTTKERLNWVLEKFNAWKIYQTHYIWYYMDVRGNVYPMPQNWMYIDLNDYNEFSYLQL